MNGIEQNAIRESRLDAIRAEAKEKGQVAAPGIRPAGSPLPVASPETGYYKQPLLKQPQWTPLIPVYFFVGGATGALGVIGSLADVLGGDRELARKARSMATGGAVLSSALLVADLGRPSRFLNMLRVFKPQSTMSMGSWALSAFSLQRRHFDLRRPACAAAWKPPDDSRDPRNRSLWLCSLRNAFSQLHRRVNRRVCNPCVEQPDSLAAARVWHVRTSIRRRFAGTRRRGGKSRVELARITQRRL